MNKNKMEKSQFISSTITCILLYIITILRVINKKPFWYLILIVALAMTVSAYNSYKKIKENN